MRIIIDNPALRVAAILALQALIFGVVVAWDRWRVRRRDPRRTMPVVDRRTLGDALRAVSRLDRTNPDDVVPAIFHLTAARQWLLAEFRHGSHRRRVRLAAALEQVELQLQQWRAPAGLYE